MNNAYKQKILKILKATPTAEKEADEQSKQVKKKRTKNAEL